MNWGNRILTVLALSLGISGLASATPVVMPVQHFQLAQKGAAITAHLDYYGGPVLSNVKVYSVYWGSSVNVAVTSKMGDFFTTITNSPYMDWLKEYNTNIAGITGHAGSNQTIGRGSFGGDYTITPANKATTLDDSAISVELVAQIAAGKLPKPDANSMYMLNFPAGITITLQGSTSCQDFCAYHSSTVTSSNQNVVYGVMPDFTGSCATGCGSNAWFDNYTSAASHEMVEATTDTLVGEAAALDYPLAWYDSNNGEIGDICAYQSQGTITSPTDGTPFVVQGQWSNARNACEVGP